MARRAVDSFGQTARIAQTCQFGRGVNPSPVPDPQSLQNCSSPFLSQREARGPHLPDHPEAREKPVEAEEAEAGNGYGATLLSVGCKLSLTSCAAKGKHKAPPAAKCSVIL